MNRRRWFSFATPVVLCAALLFPVAPATQAARRQDPPTETQENPQDEAEARKAAKKAAKEARIAEYLRKREERRLRREQLALEREQARKIAAEEAERKRQEDAMEAEIREMEKAHAEEIAATEKARKNGHGTLRDSKLPRGLARAQAAVRQSRLGDDPNMIQYLDLVENQQASAQQLGAIGNFLSRAGMQYEAMEYYNVALKLDKQDPVLWVNAGTLHRQAGRMGQAIDAYLRALRLDRNNAVAHYNLGASFDQQGKYEEALEEYKVALRLDPDLGDPAVNPQAANNEHLAAVKLLLYQEQAGGLGVPLVDVPGGGLEPAESSKN